MTIAPLIKPERLQAGDVVGVISPASPPPDPNAIDRSIAALEKLGFKPRLAPHARQRHGFLAGSDADRAADLMEMFRDTAVKAIFCIRGGYGTARLLPMLDYDVIRKHAKILVGFSDATTLHCALLIHANLISFHGPMLNSGLAGSDTPPFVVQSLLRAITQPTPTGSLCQGYGKETLEVVRGGIAEGALIGGNLTVLCTTLGTRYQPDFKAKILLLEEVDEKPYRVDRNLTHLRNAGVLGQVAGVAVGINHNCTDPKAGTATEYRQTVMDVLRERLDPLGVPVVTGLPFGHVPWNATFPLGVSARLDGENADLVITEAGVC